MGNLRILSASEQVAEYLRAELLSARWSGTMPGEDALIAQLGAGRATVQAAVRQLEEEGLLVYQGAGRRRLIVLPENHVPPAIRIAILRYEADDNWLGYLLDLQHQLREAGHTAFFAPKSLIELKMNVKRVQGVVSATEADAWVVVAGSRPVLEWSRPPPCCQTGLRSPLRPYNISRNGASKHPAIFP